MRLLIDLQGYQGSSRNRGIGRYSHALTSTMISLERDIDYRILLNEGLRASVEPIHREYGPLLQAPGAIRHFGVRGPIDEVRPENRDRILAAELVREAALRSHRPDHLLTTSLFEGLTEDVVVSAPRLGAGFTTSTILYDLIPYTQPQIYLADARHRAWYHRKLASLQRSDLLLAISEHSRSEAISRLGIPAERVLNISAAVSDFFRKVDLSPQQAGELRNRRGLDRPFVMYTGGLDSRKNIEGLIEAYCRLPGAVRDAHQLAVVCSINPKEHERLSALARSFGLRDGQVVLTGFVPDEELRALYNLCELFVFPPLYEGFGLPALEAMACGAPTIASNTTSIPEVIGRDDAMFDPTDLDAIAAMMARVLESPSLREDLRRHAAVQARRFSWEISARKALDGIRRCVRENPIAAPTVRSRAARPTLALVSPLPPLKSGISDYCAELIPSLSCHYDITVVSRHAELTDDWVGANLPVITPQEFSARYAEFDRVLYQFGNSEFHAHMFQLLASCPGVVVMHDFFLSGVTGWMEQNGAWPTRLLPTLYASHGYGAVIDHQRNGREHSIQKYPCNLAVLAAATGVVVHSEHSLELARSWYGELDFGYWRKVPQLRSAQTRYTRAQARRKLGLGDDELLVATFGLLGGTKYPAEIMDAWLRSDFARRPDARFVFVGEDPGGRYAAVLAEKTAAAGAGKLSITGFVSADDYEAWLAAADIGVQLRTGSRGETSRAVLDCLAYGLPLIINRHGSNAEYTDTVALVLPDRFTTDELVDALNRLSASPDLRAALSAAARELIVSKHGPARAAQGMRDAIEAFAQAPRHAESLLVGRLADLARGKADLAGELPDIAACIATNRGETRPARVLVDLTPVLGANGREAGGVLAAQTRSWLQQLLHSSTSAARVEPIYWSAAGWRHARAATAALLELPEDILPPDALAAIYAEDVVLALQAPASAPDGEDAYGQALSALRRRSARLAVLEPTGGTRPDAADLVLQASTPAQAIGILRLARADHAPAEIAPRMSA
jgi:glycosyltransferase involved in cell wall biosynthesis